MLQHLHIENYAIIDQIDIRFPDSLSVITGETGAGKSILMGALNLILGERADSSVLMYEGRKCIVEGSFLMPQDKAVEEFLLAGDLDVQPEILLRREIAPSGKSRAFINDSPVSLQQMKFVASSLVDLHQQFDTIELGDLDMQREVVDAVAQNSDVLKSYRNVFEEWKKITQQLRNLQDQKVQFQKELDYNNFLFSELEEAGFKENELEDLDQQLQILSNAESIKTSLAKAYFDLKESEQPVTVLLKQQLQQLQPFTEFDSVISSIVDRLKSCQIELDDIAQEISSVNDTMHYDEQRINEINERMAVGYRLLKKHQVQTTAELIAIQQELGEKLQAVLKTDELISALNLRSENLLKDLSTLAATISSNRRKVIPSIGEKVNQLLKQVGMPNAAIKIAITKTELNRFGTDQIEFLFDANSSGKFEPLRKVASGGELSRLMLCIKSIVAENIQIATMIFDEIDAGISGEAARQVGILLKELATIKQVICITHQPQIAGKGHQHFFVYKITDEGKIKTRIKVLSREERIRHIAQMLSGENPTGAALENAREMVGA